MRDIKIKFSIVCPVFNRGTSIHKTITSVLSQKYDNFELLLIDDGSTDSTRENVEKYSAIDKRIKYFYQENQGPFCARLMGLRKVDADYFLFLDSDDLLLENALEKLSTSIIKNEYPDLILFNFQRNGGKMYCDKLNRFDIVKNSNDPLNELFVKTTSYFLWDKCYKSNLINKANFNFNFNFRRIGEDTLMLYELAKNASSLVKIDDILYQYNYNEDSLVRNKNRDDAVGQKNIYSYIYTQLGKKYTNVNPLIINQIFDFYMGDFTYSSKKLKFKEWKKRFINFKEFNRIVKMKHLHTNKKKIFIFIYRLKFYFLMYIVFKYFV